MQREEPVTGGEHTHGDHHQADLQYGGRCRQERRIAAVRTPAGQFRRICDGARPAQRAPVGGLVISRPVVQWTGLPATNRGMRVRFLPGPPIPPLGL